MNNLALAKHRFDPGRIIALPMVLNILCGIGLAEASRFGVSGYSGNPNINNGMVCSFCHSGGSIPNVMISGPEIVDAGTTNDYTVTISGGPAQTGGVNISASDSNSQLNPADSDLFSRNGELLHNLAKAFSEETESVSFNFQWTAPDYNTDILLYAAGNSANNNGSPSGDGIDHTSLRINVRNGTQPVPPIPPNPQPDNGIELQEFISGLNQPVAIAHGGDERLFVVEHEGRIQVVENQTITAQYLDIVERVDSSSGEMGVLGLAFHPDYDDNGYFYLYYTYTTETSERRSRISRFQVSTSDPNSADANSELILLEFAQPFGNHNGGDIHFGADGYLYIASGDGGSANDPQDNGQSDTTLLGKLLRIDVDNSPGLDNAPDCDLSANSHYSIPPGNAFNDGIGGACDEIYSTGLRNPWRFSFDKETADLWIADVGQNAWEEINFLPAGTVAGINFGWRCYEADEQFNSQNCLAEESYYFPIHAYSHNNGCSITGGYVYRGQLYPELTGHYFFTDFCDNAIHSISGSASGTVVNQMLAADQAAPMPSSFGEDVNGELYIASYNGTIYRLATASENQPPAVSSPGDQSSQVGDIIALSISATDPDQDTLSYSATGLPADLNIDSATGIISGTLSASGTFNSEVSVSDGENTVAVSFVWQVNIVNQAPEITNPGDQTSTVNDEIMLQIQASDTDKDTLFYSAQGLPDGLSINDSNGSITGTISKAGTFNSTVTVNDGSESASAMFVWTVKEEDAPNPPPVITNPGDQTNEVGDTVMLQIDAKSAENTAENLAENPQALTFSAEGLPEGLTIAADSGTITGTTSSAGTFDTTVSVSEGEQSSSVMFRWTIKEASTPPTSVIGEIGRVVKVNQPDPDTWHTVKLQQSYQDPIVVMGPASRRGGHPLTIRVRNVSANGFEFQLDEWDYLSGKHSKEFVSYMVVEAGVHNLKNGKQLIAGKTEAANQDWQTQTFASVFPQPPIVLSQVSSVNESSAVVTRQRSVSAAQFELRLQEEQANDGQHAAESVHWIAMEPFAEKGVSEVGLTRNAVTHRQYSLKFQQRFRKNPMVFLAAMQTANDEDPAGLRYRAFNRKRVKIFVQEEKSQDREIRHQRESVGFMVFAKPGIIQ